MEYTHLLVLLSVVLSVIAASAYIRDMVRGTTKPNRVSYFLWALAPLIGTGAALSAGADVWATVRIFMSGFVPLTTLVVSFFLAQSYWKLTRFDLLCGVFSVVALCVWIFADAPRTAILFAAFADGFALIPTLRKAWRYPETETGVTYVIGFLAAIVVIPVIPVWNIENSAFQIYLMTANTLLVLAVYRRRLGF